MYVCIYVYMYIHLPPTDIEEECLLHGPSDLVPPGIFDLIDKQRTFDFAMNTKCSAGPSGMDAELYCRIPCFLNFGAEGKTLRQEIAILTGNLLKYNYHSSLLEDYTKCRLIPLDKNPRVKIMGVGEVLIRIIGKTTAAIVKKKIKEGHSAGADAARFLTRKGRVGFCQLMRKTCSIR